jgi:hypothetical protein
VNRFAFKPVKREQRGLILSWLAMDHIKEWVHGQGLKNLLNGLEKFFGGTGGTSHWIAYDGEIPFAYLLTSTVDAGPDGIDYPPGEAITLDLFICDLNYIGKKLSHIMIREFLTSQFPSVKTVFIDPEATNVRAIRAYEKVGFRKIGEFIASWHPVPHWQMKLSMNDLL